MAAALDPYSQDWRRAAITVYDGSAAPKPDIDAPGPGVLLYLLPLGAGQQKVCWITALLPKCVVCLKDAANV